MKTSLFLSRFRIKIQRLIRRCPRQIRVLAAPLLGGLIGLIGGIPGFIIGFLLGYLLRNVFIQSVQDRRILDYFENPGLQEFYEGESGLAAWCALGALISSKNYPEFPADKSVVLPEILPQVIIGASRAYSGAQADPYLIEHFSRLALSRIDSLNPDLLAESLAARRIPKGDAGNLYRSLFGLALEKNAKDLLHQISPILDPAGENATSEDFGSGVNGKDRKDPWKILGLPPGTPFREIKAHYRRLAKQFHPDELEVLDKEQRETAARAFIAIQEAYKEITEK